MNSNPFGFTYELWTSRWWKWLISIPKPFNPALDITGDNSTRNQYEKDVWFIAGTVKPLTSVNRTFVIPFGRSILLPLVNNLVSFLEYPDAKNENDLLAIVGKDYLNGVEMQLVIDGSIINNTDVCRVRTNPFQIIYPPDNIFDTKPGNSIAVSDGFWVFLQPLSKGNHSIYLYSHEPNYEERVCLTIDVR